MSDCRDQRARRRAAIAFASAKILPRADPAPARSGGATRRAVLASLGAALLISACGRREAMPSAVAAPSPAPVEAGDFLRVSQALTGHPDLDATTAARLVQAFARAAPDVQAHFGALGAVVHAGVSAPEALAAATAAGLRPVALAIVAAWYTGTVGQGTRALTVSYRDALMQRPVADALTPPTYVGGGPGWWTAPPPDVGLPGRAAQAVSTTKVAESFR